MARRLPARRDGYAPYNFVSTLHPYEQPNPPRFGSGTEDEPPLSATLELELEALTPLLVSGEQPHREPGKPAIRSFFSVNGNPVIPGSSLKGLVRSLVEALSNASVAPISEGFVYSRNPTTPQSTESRTIVAAWEEGRLKAGLLTVRGASRTIKPCTWLRVKDAPQDRRGTAAQKTDTELGNNKTLGIRFGGSKPYVPPAPQGHGGHIDAAAPDEHQATGIGPNGNRAGRLVYTGDLGSKEVHGYVFEQIPDVQPRSISPEVWECFEAQKTDAQNDLIRTLRAAGLSIPVFYIVESKDPASPPSQFGLSKYFRVKQRQSPRSIGAKSGRGLTDWLFGFVGNRASAGSNNSLRGRVVVTAARCTVSQRSESYPDLLPGGPSASAVGMYVTQPDGVGGQLEPSRRNENLRTYDHDDARLRGRKFYWHRDPPTRTSAAAGSQNEKMVAEYRPLAAGTKFEFSVHMHNVAAYEIGAVLEGLLRPGAVKLGLGKPFGFGSCKITLKSATVDELTRRYRSLSSRINGPAPLPDAKVMKLREDFRRAVADDSKTFDQLQFVREFDRIHDFKNRPAREATEYMRLHDGDPSYKHKPILRNLLDVKTP